MIHRAITYVRNAAAMWSTLIPDTSAAPGWVRIDFPATTRLILLEPPTQEAYGQIGGLSPAKNVLVEDVFSEPEAAPLTAASRKLHMPVMNRDPGRISSTAHRAAQVIEVRTPDHLAEAERVIVDGFPLQHYQPWIRAQALPPRVLAAPGWRTWLALRNGTPAAAACTYDDGRATGVYWLATLPEHRSCGLARAVLTAAINARPDHEFTLVATAAGRPLYESLGFVAVTTTTWHTRPPLSP